MGFHCKVTPKNAPRKKDRNSKIHQIKLQLHVHSSIVQRQSTGKSVHIQHLFWESRLTGFLVCMNTVPGPVNLHTSPSPEDRPEIIPPEATLSRIYFVFQATRWPLSTMYLSPSASYFLISTIHTKSRGRSDQVAHIFPNDCTQTANPQ